VSARPEIEHREAHTHRVIIIGNLYTGSTQESLGDVFTQLTQDVWGRDLTQVTQGVVWGTKGAMPPPPSGGAFLGCTSLTFSSCVRE